MKKLLYILLFAFLASIFFSACMSSNKAGCAAYGESQDYRKDKR